MASRWGVNQKDLRSRRLYSDILLCFTRKQHKASFEVFLDLLLDESGRPPPQQATVKSPAAISRFLGRTAPMRTFAPFLNHATWNTRRLCRVLRQHALASLQDVCRTHPHPCPRLELLVGFCQAN